MADRQRAQSLTEASNAALTVRVDSLQADISRVGNDVRSLSSKIDLISRPATPQYTTWIAASGLIISLMVGFFTLGISPIKEAIAKNDGDLRASVTKVEHTAALARKELADDLKEIRGAVVPRGEHEQRWRSFEASLANISSRLDETRKTLSDLYSPKDALKDLQKQIDDMRSIMMKKE